MPCHLTVARAVDFFLALLLLLLKCAKALSSLHNSPLLCSADLCCISREVRGGTERKALQGSFSKKPNSKCTSRNKTGGGSHTGMSRITTIINTNEWLLLLPIIIITQLTLIILPVFLNWFLPENSSLRPKASTLNKDSAGYL